MITKSFFAIASSLFVFLGGIPYLLDIHKKNVQPHVLSWLGWAFITALGAFAMIAEGSTWIVAILFANSLLCFSVVIYSLVKKVGVWAASKYDVLFSLGFLGLVLWQVFEQPLIALVSAILADLFFGLPTIIKTYLNPKTETPFVWIAATISGALSLFAAESFVFHEVGYPTYLLLFDSIVLLLVLKVVRK